jgi:alkaline phosphatase D
VRRRAAAYQAYYEHMPLRRTARPVGPEMRLYTSASFGDLATFLMLDNRQYRSDQACGSPGDLGGQLVENCAERTAAARTMLGPEQERWVGRQLATATATARWKVLGQQMLMAQLEQKAGAGEAWWSDGWDGYPAGRARLLGQVAERRIKDVVVIGGDIHSFWVTDLKADFADPGSATVASEFVIGPAAVLRRAGALPAHADRVAPVVLCLEPILDPDFVFPPVGLFLTRVQNAT